MGGKALTLCLVVIFSATCKADYYDYSESTPDKPWMTKEGIAEKMSIYIFDIGLECADSAMEIMKLLEKKMFDTAEIYRRYKKTLYYDEKGLATLLDILTTHGYTESDLMFSLIKDTLQGVRSLGDFSAHSSYKIRHKCGSIIERVHEMISRLQLDKKHSTFIPMYLY
uniref:Uncharacterized protein n=2 Tax=Clastoptera arizonana TaxID=38151 RepID=A0A1B6E5G6_9HEMI